MNCQQAIPLLSAFHDGELAPADQEAIVEHIKSCVDCSRRLKSFQSLSALVQRSPTPQLSDDFSERVEGALLENRGIVNRRDYGYQRRIFAALLTIAAVFAGFLIWNFAWKSERDHHESDLAYEQFLDAYAADKNEATQILVGHYNGKSIDAKEAAQALKRDSVAPPTLLTKHKIANRFLLPMPDCNCVGTVYSQEGSTSFVLFEHEKEHAEWFEKRQMIRTKCGGTSCCLIQLDGTLLATWRANGYYVTVVGIPDVAQLQNLMQELTGA